MRSGAAAGNALVRDVMSIASHLDGVGGRPEGRPPCVDLVRLAEVREGRQVVGVRTDPVA